MKLQDIKRSPLQSQSWGLRAGSALGKLIPVHTAASLRNVSCCVSMTEKTLNIETSATTVVDRPVAAEVRTPSALNQTIREGHYEAALVNLQASKADAGQASIASVLKAADPATTADVTIVGAGPAGLYLAAELARRGLTVNVLGLDVPIVNNYGVWTDEFQALGLEHTLECSWPDAVCYFGEDKEVRVGRGYGRVSRRKLRAHLLSICEAAGVRFSSAEVADIQLVEGGKLTQVTTKDGTVYRSRLTTLAAGAAAGKFLRYEENAPIVAAQTAYGIEAEVEGYDRAYPSDLMLFMDFRRHHTGLYDATALNVKAGRHPNSGDGMWGSSDECPSFLYAMPLGGKRVFVEETCLVAKPALPFAVLKRRLTRRLKAMGISVTKIHEEEWSYIPVGGPLPLASQSVTAFGAAANLIHPATGFSVSRSFREAPLVAEEITAALREGLDVAAASQRVWDKLWPTEKRTQASFHVFGMELLATLDLSSTNDFFNTFFRLPSYYWRGFLASTLSAGQLIAFALVVFTLAPFSIKYKLIEHLMTDPAGGYLIRAYKAQWDTVQEASSTGTAVAAVLIGNELMTHAVLRTLADQAAAAATTI
ncbi:hypothetical protein Vretimale_13250 [Volvox reticuliferus]|uniref:Lycopene epsilon cyclase n=1 Tax=Volvox reticuliferus TaxID=1737510 RepID=A0A8J4FQ84_9CHLO|nr:hypothetical protein Vretifemale_14194 [Volvox reticuliferus]GIM09382.1 hypothetical protein Vretimale_13250 [Volvox reticuliferus]